MSDFSAPLARLVFTGLREAKSSSIWKVNALRIWESACTRDAFFRYVSMQTRTFFVGGIVDPRKFLREYYSPPLVVNKIGGIVAP